MSTTTLIRSKTAAKKARPAKRAVKNTPLRATAKPSGSRLHFRISSTKRAVIEQAATMTGSTLSEYLVDRTYRMALEDIERHQRIQIAAADGKQFLAILNRKGSIPASLRRALESAKQVIDRT